MNKSIVCLVLMMLGFPLWGSSQQLYTLEQCIVWGMENHLDVKIQNLQIKAFRAAEITTASRFLPDISARINHFYNFGSTINPQTNARESANIQSDNISVDAGINLFNFEDLNKSRISRLQTAIAQADKAVIDQEFASLLIQRYTEALAAQELKKVITHQLVNSKEQLDRIEKEVADGAKPESDIYDIQVIYTQEQKLLKQTEQDELNKKALLVQLINKEDICVANMNLIQDVPSNDNPSPSVLWENNPAVMKEQLTQQKLQQEYRQLLHQYLPTVRLNYSYGTFYATAIDQIFDTSFKFGSQLKDNRSQYLGLNLSIPIFSKGDVRRLRTRKNIDILQQQEVITKKETELKNELQNQSRKQQQYAELEATLTEASLYASKAYETTKVKYEYGKVDVSAYKAAKNQLLMARYDVLNNALSEWMTGKIIQNLLSDQYIKR
ncbi:TolC family protein [Sphingobacterium spiritivorum]|uniref:TolC family protein n=1 Tax=Sphingobacterium spiritivorum TaxID=258 RepID=UPI003DA4C97A